VKSLRLTIIICAALTAMQTFYVFVMTGNLQIYLQIMRPGIYMVLTITVCAIFGRNRRISRKALQSRVAVIAAIALLTVTLIVGIYMFGGAVNYHVPNWSMRFWHIWTVGSVVVMREIIRYKLIRASNDSERSWVILLLLIALVYAQLDGLQMIYRCVVIDPILFLFTTLFPAVTVGGVASYMSLESKFYAVLTFSLVYTLVPDVVPVLPYIRPLSWSLTVTAAAFMSGLIYRAVMNDKSSGQKKREKLRAKYFSKKPWLMNSLTVGIIGLVVAFFLGMFPIYPVAILTGSMAGTFEQGSLVFVRRVPSGMAYDMVGEGYAIHFRRNRLEYIHRTVEFVYGADGRREYITQGDAPGALRDPWQTAQDDVLGIAVTFLPYLGWPYVMFYFLRSPS